MATLSTSIGLPINIPLGVVSLAGASISGVATALTKKYQKKISKLTDIVTSALSVFEMRISEALTKSRLMNESFKCFRTFTLR